MQTTHMNGLLCVPNGFTSPPLAVSLHFHTDDGTGGEVIPQIPKNSLFFFAKAKICTLT